jgi:RNA-directed DNA polymerase
MIAEAQIDSPWHRVNWRRAKAAVRRLQTRIVKATKAGKWRLIRKLQNLLTRSTAAKFLAVRRVTSNRGKKTPGVDGVVLDTPKAKWQAMERLNSVGYHPSPLKRVYLPKPNGKRRPLGIPTLQDRAMQALHSLALEPVVETISDPHSYGFRSERSTQDAREQCFNALAKRNQARWVLEADIEGCFDNLDQQWLVNHTPMDKRILKKWLKAGFLEEGRLHETPTGTPQGGNISPNLANVALNGLESAILGHFTCRQRKAHKLNVVRYADDFIVTGATPEVLEDEVKPVITAFLAERGLKLSEDKTKITPIEAGFDFLGFNIRKYQGKLLIKPTKDSIKHVIKRLRDTFKANLSAKTGNLIQQLNPLIRGWANYYRGSVASVAFAKIDRAIAHASWKWARRRHPKKSSGWIKRRYFPQGSRLTAQEGLHLAKMADKPIQRHVKIQAEANPYDPQWEPYFEKRWERQWKTKHPSTLKTLWLKQNGLCPACQGRLGEEDELDTHHLKPKALGGTDTLDNLVLLHSTCHKQVHHFHGKEASPAALRRLIQA